MVKDYKNFSMFDMLLISNEVLCTRNHVYIHMYIRVAADTHQNQVKYPPPQPTTTANILIFPIWNISCLLLTQFSVMLLLHDTPWGELYSPYLPGQHQRIYTNGFIFIFTVAILPCNLNASSHLRVFFFFSFFTWSTSVKIFI